jgi:hypothetical protein
MPRFQDIPQFTRNAPYAVDVGWDYLPLYYAGAILEEQLNVSPDFQRGYVWTPEQKVRYVEFILRGGQTGKDLYTNCPGWKYGQVGESYPNGWYVLVDGKQRLDAVLGFLNNEFPIFGGNYRRDYSDRTDIVRCNFRWHVNDLETRDEMLSWYIDLNSGGTVHSPDEINRVRGLIGSGAYTAPSTDEIVTLANLDREVLQEAVRLKKAQEAERQENYRKFREAEANAPKKKARRK